MKKKKKKLKNVRLKKIICKEKLFVNLIYPISFFFLKKYNTGLEAVGIILTFVSSFVNIIWAKQINVERFKLSFENSNN